MLLSGHASDSKAETISWQGLLALTPPHLTCSTYATAGTTRRRSSTNSSSACSANINAAESGGNLQIYSPLAKRNGLCLRCIRAMHIGWYARVTPWRALLMSSLTGRCVAHTTVAQTTLTCLWHSVTGCPWLAACCWPTMVTLVSTRHGEHPSPLKMQGGPQL